MKPRVLLLIGVLAAAFGVFYLLAAPDASRAVSPGAEPEAVRPPSRRKVTDITFLYSTEKREWVEAALAEFQPTHPHVRVTLVGRGSLDAAQAILEGREQPTVWSPADSAVLRMLAADWATDTSHGPLFATQGEAAPQPLVITPLVFVGWQDRMEVLRKAGGGGGLSWKTLQRAVASDQGWPSVGGPAEWGFVKLGHTDPTKSNSGLQALLSATLEYLGRRAGVKQQDLLSPGYQEWLKHLERGVTRFEPSTGIFMTDLVRFGPSRYDLALVYESLVISQLGHAQGRWGTLQVDYPPVTLWSDHPAAVLQADWVTPEQREAALEWVGFLRSKPVQARALAFGFRPADPSVPLKTQDADNPFTRLAAHGIRVDVPPAAEVPDVAVLRTLLDLWSRIGVGR
ncbi:ABC transporter substrate-binding protein [Corallococcus praedator]|uniref:ABC transporter substrate-binding protein n=1 Tax=Corallococcus praedator TaxID=2316724 RepID=A0ABX9QPD4_9BACT|nr:MULTISPECIES: substrate-binding domain-containing protein [Corallococcus]RKH18357.1 ABC transporter substrate-binding protein [Corallococcus sp. CA047B]RKH32807.1 ABC transporter substrate-binding protein [Corallococcus sp. CA031C]RKI13464.1 ABC transporter substrate-binding protein [Corallococcus praedator]